jgi:hypothetical protein
MSTIYRDLLLVKQTARIAAVARASGKVLVSTPAG